MSVCKLCGALGGMHKYTCQHFPERPGVTANKAAATDPVNHPAHYTTHPSGIECIQITEHMGFNLGNAIKYVWRADLKGSSLQDLRKAIWYIAREIQKREAAS